MVAMLQAAMMDMNLLMRVLVIVLVYANVSLLHEEKTHNNLSNLQRH